MIKLGGHQLVLNSFDVPGYEYSMWLTWKMPKKTVARDVIYWIGYACDQSPDANLNHVVINSHGSDGQMAVGMNDRGFYNHIDNMNVDLFSSLRNKSIGTLWFTGCLLAETTWGQSFCRKLAVNIGCQVVAANTEQEGWNSVVGALFMPRNHIDDFEGQVYRWDAHGSMERFQPNGGDF